jgi:hypothetical protein
MICLGKAFVIVKTQDILGCSDPPTRISQDILRHLDKSLISASSGLSLLGFCV